MWTLSQEQLLDAIKALQLRLLHLNAAAIEKTKEMLAGSKRGENYPDNSPDVSELRTLLAALQETENTINALTDLLAQKE
jgi:hypothetical protein